MMKPFHLTLSPLIAHFLMPNKATVLFALKGVIAVAMALGVAMYLALDNPAWAAIPAVMLQARPHSGFVIEKALFLIASSLIGAALAFLILDYFIHEPAIAIALLALIIAIVTFFSSTVRHGNFVFGLALIAITPNMIVLFAISHIESISSQTIFNIAFARVSEVMVGASCAIFASALLFPLRMKDVLATHTALLVNHVENYLSLIFDVKQDDEKKEKQLKTLLGLVVLINDDSSPNFYEHRKNTRRALYMVNQTLTLIAFSKSLNFRVEKLDIDDLLEKVNVALLQKNITTKLHTITDIRLDLKRNESADNVIIINKTLNIYENILLAEIESRNHSEVLIHHGNRLKAHRDINLGFIASLRAVTVYLACIAIWAMSDGSATLSMMIILPILFTQMFVQAPNPALVVLKIFKGVLLSIPIAVFILLGMAASAVGYLELFFLVLLPFLYLGLMAMTNPITTPYGLGFCLSMITLLQPSNHMTFAAAQSLGMGLGVALSTYLTYMAFQVFLAPSGYKLQKNIVYELNRRFKTLGNLKNDNAEKFNRCIAEKLFFLSSYQQDTKESRKLFKCGLLALSAGHVLLDISQEFKEQKLTNLVYLIRDQLYQILLLAFDEDQVQINNKLKDLEAIMDNVRYKAQILELIRVVNEN